MKKFKSRSKRSAARRAFDRRLDPLDPFVIDQMRTARGWEELTEVEKADRREAARPDNITPERWEEVYQILLKNGAIEK